LSTRARPSSLVFDDDDVVVSAAARAVARRRCAVEEEKRFDFVLLFEEIPDSKSIYR
jgi:hypothetical protein